VMLHPLHPSGSYSRQGQVVYQQLVVLESGASPMRMMTSILSTSIASWWTRLPPSFSEKARSNSEEGREPSKRWRSAKRTMPRQRFENWMIFGWSSLTSPGEKGRHDRSWGFLELPVSLKHSRLQFQRAGWYASQNQVEQLFFFSGKILSHHDLFA